MSQFTVIKGSGSDAVLKSSCVISLDNKKESFTDFVAIGYDNKTGTTTLLQNTDTVTLGMAFKLLAKAFKESYGALSSLDKALVDSVLQGGSLE